MRIAAAVLLTLIPVMALAIVEPKDKYICNCHVTPGINGTLVSAPSKVTASKPATAKPVVHKKRKHVASKPKTTDTAAVATTPKPRKHKRIVAKKSEGVGIPVNVGGESYPGNEEIITSNKLVLPAGKSVYAPGQLVYISGRVLDAKMRAGQRRDRRYLATQSRRPVCEIDSGRTFKPGTAFYGFGTCDHRQSGTVQFRYRVSGLCRQPRTVHPCPCSA